MSKFTGWVLSSFIGVAIAVVICYGIQYVIIMYSVFFGDEMNEVAKANLSYFTHGAFVGTALTIVIMLALIIWLPVPVISDPLKEPEIAKDSDSVETGTGYGGG